DGLKPAIPHNLEHTPGGSSSGSAAGLAAGMFPISIGSQTAGSVVRPAAFCGIAGFKPSHRLVPTVGMKCYSWALDTFGVFAAGIADVAFAASGISGRDLRVDRAKPQAPRIAVVRTHLWDEASEPMKQALEAAAKAAEKDGASVKDFTLPPIFEQAYEAQDVISCYEAYRALAFEYDNHRDQLSPFLRQTLEEAGAIKPETYDEARRTTKRARQAFGDIMEQNDIILTPSASGAAPHGLEFTGATTFNRLWTLLGPPCMNVPGLFDQSGLPLGVQVVGRFGRDLNALQGALFVESAIARHCGR
ncbi:MAG TPA: amidase family protein, partial [Xanthobacteraceae bacterium]|nr:amidase family protein [Xanthobacteraceae bacterium]